MAQPQPTVWDLGHGSPWSWQPILDAGLVCRTVIDVGAAGGTPSLFEAFPDAYWVLIEPLCEFHSVLHEVLSEKDGKLVGVAAGSRSGSAVLRVSKQKLLQSSLNDRVQFAGGMIEEREIRVERLDDIVRCWQLGLPYFLKIDVEGSEHDVLLGAVETLKKTAGIAIEVNSKRSYPHLQDNLRAVDRLLHESGFELRAILDAEIGHTSRHTRELVKADLLYTPVRGAWPGETGVSD